MQEKWFDGAGEVGAFGVDQCMRSGTATPVAMDFWPR
jgi:hypothetical protein